MFMGVTRVGEASGFPIFNSHLLPPTSRFQPSSALLLTPPLQPAIAPPPPIVSTSPILPLLPVSASIVFDSDHISVIFASASTTWFALLPFKTPNRSSFHEIKIQLSSSSPPLRIHRQNLAVVMVAKRKEEIEEIGSKSTEDINEEIIDLKSELFMLRLQKSACGEFKSSEFGRMRKRVSFQSP
ncbi:hypothetical protein ACLOJK_025830 [Asimina triloba]